jgi:hypothetical protein
MRRLTTALSVCLALGAHAVLLAQARPDFSGTWRLNQAKSSRAVVGNNPDIPFPSQIEVTQSPTDISVRSTSVRQQPVSAVYKLDGSKVNVQAPEGITETGEARLDGPKLLITSRRSFSSPAGDIVVEFKETWILDGGALTIEKTRTQSGESSTQKAVYDKL